MSHASAGRSLEGTELGRVLAEYVDPQWYLRHYADVPTAGIDPVLHFIRIGAADGRDPNPFFDSAWYQQEYTDVADSGAFPLLHYLFTGAADRRDPHPRFDAEHYIAEHPDAASNPLLYHIRIGHARGYATEKLFQIHDYLPSQAKPPTPPPDVTVDVVIPVHRALTETKRCLDSVLADTSRPLGRVIVIDDRSPEPELVAFLRGMEAAGRITLLRNRRNLGFVASVNRGMEAAGENDVVLLNSGTEVPPGWLPRLAAQARVAPRIASVAPFSNTATICGYPDDTGKLAFDHTPRQIDDACRTVNPGRFVDLPTTAGICIYIRRAALRDVGMFDAERFPHHHAETDFCLRATAKGWTHRLTCDTFVSHNNPTDDRQRKAADEARDLILQRFPDYRRRLASHARRAAATPYRFAITTALFRLSKLPVILMLARDEAGGVRRHIDSLAARTRDQARVLLLQESQHGYTLSAPSHSGPKVTIPQDRQHDLEQLLRAIPISRLHIHTLPTSPLNVRALIRHLGVPFDVTLHDYEAICPQRILLRWPDALYCGEPGPATCNACIADSTGQGHGARDILSWRLERAWLFLDADRVICPSEDAKHRLDHYGLAHKTVVAPQESPPPGDWPATVPPLTSGPLRVALLVGTPQQNAAQNIATLAAAMPPKTLDLRLIGDTDNSFPTWVKPPIPQTGPHADNALPTLIQQARPHVIWFATSSPEPCNEALPAAIASGLPIVAPDIGVFPEQLHGRPLTWLLHHRASATETLAVFSKVRQSLLAKPAIPATPRAPAKSTFYETAYLKPTGQPRAVERPVIMALAERNPDGSITADTYVRLLQPLDHPAVARNYQLVLADADSVAQRPCQIIITRPQAVPDRATAAAIIRHAQANGIKLIVDLDDDHFGHGHPVADLLIAAADATWVATESLAAAHPNAIVLETRPDERLWLPTPPARPWEDPIELIWLGSPKEAQDHALLEPTLLRLKQSYDERIAIKVLGLPETVKPPDGIDAIRPPPLAASAYPSFVHWLRTQASAWHIGLAPMADDPSNRSTIRAWEFAALGIPVLASNVPAYRGSPADGRAGELVRNTPVDWYAAIDRLIRNPAARSDLAARARPEFDTHGTLGTVADLRRLALDDLIPEHQRTHSALPQAKTYIDKPDELSGTTTRTRRRSGRG